MYGRNSWPLLLACFFGVGFAILTPDTALDAPIRSPDPHHGYKERLPGSTVTFDMVAIAGGTFERGSPDGESGREPQEGPRHPVRIPPFWMGKTEVTWDEYDLFRKGGPVGEDQNEAALATNADVITRPTPTYPDEYRGFGKAGYPVVGISHHAAMEYCRWLSQVTGKSYRLPTEAEWEYACRFCRVPCGSRCPRAKQPQGNQIEG
jgi:formylglycine-generating enzyme required for sulfatase activity